MHSFKALATLALIPALVACGGGSGGGTNQTIGSSPSVTSPDSLHPEPNTELKTSGPTTKQSGTRYEELVNDYNIRHGFDFEGNYQEVVNWDGKGDWYANLQVDLPDDGDYGLTVIRPLTGKPVAPKITISPFSSYVLREDVKTLLGMFATRAYMQWSRHLTKDPGPLELQIGEIPSSNCHGAVACYRPDLNKVILGEQWLLDNQFDLIYSERDAGDIVSEFFWVMSHEAGHQFGYMDPNGITEGCGGVVKCHAAYGSGSVMSYDLLRGNNARYEVVKEDIDLIPGGVYNDTPLDYYEVYSEGENGSGIEKYGVWLEHIFKIKNLATPDFTGWPNFTDRIVSAGWIDGTPTNNMPTGNFTYTGDFLGTDMSRRFLGSLIRADVNLDYTFSSSKMNLNIDNFEAHYGVQQGEGIEKRWRDHSDNKNGYNYTLDCSASGCSSESVDTKWYDGDWIGGVVDDYENAYVGAFVAEKD